MDAALILHKFYDINYLALLKNDEYLNLYDEKMKLLLNETIEIEDSLLEQNFQNSIDLCKESLQAASKEVK